MEESNAYKIISQYYYFYEITAATLNIYRELVMDRNA